jgi:hypothetical protein
MLIRGSADRFAKLSPLMPPSSLYPTPPHFWLTTPRFPLRGEARRYAPS